LGAVLLEQHLVAKVLRDFPQRGGLNARFTEKLRFLSPVPGVMRERVLDRPLSSATAACYLIRFGSLLATLEPDQITPMRSTSSDFFTRDPLVFENSPP